MTIRSVDDIDKKNRDKQNKEVVEDITTIIEGVSDNVEDFFKRKEIAIRNKERRNPKKIFKKFLNWLGLFGLFILVLNFVLGNIWLLSKLIKSLFFLK